MEFLFVTKIIPNLLKNDVIVGDIFGVPFEVQMIWQNIYWQAKGKCPWRKLKVSFILKC